MITRVVIYIRVSTQEQAKEGYSINEQEDRLTKYCEAHNWKLCKVYRDPGYSGGSTNRPGLKALINDVKSGKIDKVIVYKLDRLSRSQKDTLYLIEDVFNANNVDFVSMTENFDTGTPFGKAMIGILSVFAQLEREQIKERMQLGLDARAKDGYYHGGPYAPIGYDYVDGELVINEYEALQVRKIWDMAENGASIYSIHTDLTNAGYKNKYGNFKNCSVRSILSSVVYTGQISWKGEIYEGRHEAIIDKDRYEKMQKYLRDRNVGHYRKKNPFAITSLLGGLIYCGNCGARYYLKQNTVKRHKGTPADAKPNKYYTCYSRGKSSKNQIVDPNCKNKSWNEKVLDKIILDEIRKLALDPNYLENMLNQDRPEEDNSDIEIINNRIHEIDKQIAKLVDLYQIDGIDFDMINSKIQNLNNEKTTLEYEISSKEEPATLLSQEETKNILKSFNEIIDTTADKEELRNIVNALIDSIIINGEDIEIHWRFL